MYIIHYHTLSDIIMHYNILRTMPNGPSEPSREQLKKKQRTINFQLNVERNPGLHWFYFTTPFSHANQSRLGHSRFPALEAGYMCLL